MRPALMASVVLFGTAAGMSPMTWAGSPEPCATLIPPIRLAVGEPVDSAVVCRLLVALKAWIGTLPPTPPDFEPGDSARIASLNVVRSHMTEMSAAVGDTSTADHIVRRYWLTQIEADVPGRPRYFVAALDEAADTIHFGVVHR